MLSYSNKEAITEVSRVVEVVLDKLDEFHHAAPVPFASVLLAVVVRIKQWFPPIKQSFAVRENSKVDEAVKYLRASYQEAASVNDNSEEAKAEETNVETDELDKEEFHENEEKKEEVPQHVKLTVEVTRQ